MAAVLLLAGCGEPAEHLQSGASPAATSPAPGTPGVWTDDTVVAPGEEVELRFGVEWWGLGFTLERRTDAGWELAYWLASAGYGDTPSWSPAATPLEVPDLPVARDEVGTDRVAIPPGTPAGEYRICPHNAPLVDDCVAVTVED